ncbi:SAICAR synthase-like protein [Obba rivulosa]|uniref:Kinase n=1 Tax=Obba rivulosa TaxID=1052685 RepID=A0A8E2DKW2_9APHY|nr:SAICAR synthase-like protein [Obba rivulosa]
MTSAPIIANQVGGHAGLLSHLEDSDGSLLTKFALAKEVAFYEAVASDDALEPLRPFVPQFYGTLKLEGQVDTAGDRFIVLEDLTYRFDRPNVLDIKLGTVLHDLDAPPEKRARMEQVARATTSRETGVRLTGFQVFDLAAGKPLAVTKEYGKSLVPADLPRGIARFFPLATSTGLSASALMPPEPPHTVASLGTTTGTGLPADILLPILQNLREDVEALRERVAQVHVRMRSASLLVIYEADWERAREGLRLLEEAVQKCEQEQDDNEDEDEEDEDEEEQRTPIPYTVKLIDFAHTTVVPGQGPDESVLKGLDTFMTLLDGRIEEVQKQL